jgi:hypothetical protein
MPKSCGFFDMKKMDDVKNFSHDSWEETYKAKSGKQG